MNSYAFFTDSDSDLPFRFVDELELNMVYMPYMVDGKEYFDDLGRNGREKEFFDAMRKGAAPVTSLLPTAAYEEYFEPVFAAGRDILFVAFSSQLSGTLWRTRMGGVRGHRLGGSMRRTWAGWVTKSPKSTPARSWASASSSGMPSTWAQ